ncbi:MAG: TRAP transporter substrate-binding protein [Propionibacterium sp.]|nr:TRAP transporter substrate-binding protein [Propionibacterium sp.]
MKRRTFLFGAAGSAAAATLVACGGNGGASGGASSAPASGAATTAAGGGGKSLDTIRVAHYFNEAHPNHIALTEVFKPAIEEGSNGTIKVQVFPNSQLGDEEAMSNGVRNGTIEMAVPGGLLANADRKIGLVEFPFLFNDYEHGRKALDSEPGEFVKEAFRGLGAEPLGFSLNGMRVVSSNKAITKLDDFKGFRLRMPNVPVYIMTGEALGATVTPMSISEIFTALEQKVIDGQENPYLTVLANKWYEVQSHMIETYHLLSVNFYLFNQELYGGLDSETQKLIADASDKSSRHAWDLSVDLEKTVKGELEGHGMTIIIPDESFKADLNSAMDGVYEKLYADYDWAEEQVKKIKDMA